MVIRIDRKECLAHFSTDFSLNRSINFERLFFYLEKHLLIAIENILFAFYKGERRVAHVQVWNVTPNIGNQIDCVIDAVVTVPGSTHGNEPYKVAYVKTGVLVVSADKSFAVAVDCRAYMLVTRPLNSDVVQFHTAPLSNNSFELFTYLRQRECFGGLFFDCFLFFGFIRFYLLACVCKLFFKLNDFFAKLRSCPLFEPNVLVLAFVLFFRYEKLYKFLIKIFNIII